MICVRTNLKASLWLALGIYKTQRSEIHAKTAKLYIRVQPSKSLAEKVVKSQMAAMTWLQ